VTFASAPCLSRPAAVRIGPCPQAHLPWRRACATSLATTRLGRSTVLGCLDSLTDTRGTSNRASARLQHLTWTRLAAEVIASKYTAQKYDGQAADVWSCGVILYLMLVGEHSNQYVTLAVLASIQGLRCSDRFLEEGSFKLRSLK